MARYEIPETVTHVRICMAHGGSYAVWNGKTGRDEFRIIVRKREQAEKIAKLINTKQHNGVLDVFS